MVATLHDPDLNQGLASNARAMLISNAAPPVEASLGPYLALFKTLTGGNPIVSMTELSMQGTVCFERLFLGMQHLLHLSSEHAKQDGIETADAAAKWWETLEGGLRAHISRTRLFVMRALDVDASLARRYGSVGTKQWRVLIAMRYGRLNRDFFDVGALVEAAESIQGVHALTARLALTQSPEQLGADWGPEWDSDAQVLAAGNEAVKETGKEGGTEALRIMLRRLQNSSILLGVTGDALASALWMSPGSMLIQLLPYGAKGHYGREYAVLANAGPGNYLELELPGSAARFYPWTPHPTATSDSDLYWKQDPHGAALLYMKAGGLEIGKDMMVDLLSRAVKILGQRHEHDHQSAAGVGSDAHTAVAGSKGLGFDGASMSLSWHSAEGAVELLPPRGQYG